MEVSKKLCVLGANWPTYATDPTETTGEVKFMATLHHKHHHTAEENSW